MSVEFHDYRIQCKAIIRDHAEQFLEEAASEIESAAARNTPVDSGQLKGAWTHVVDVDNLEATIGNPLEYSIWVEMGTGEYAMEGKGRKGGWKYKDDQGKWRFTYGMKPVRMLHNAFVSLKNPIQNLAKSIFGGMSSCQKQCLKLSAMS
jgi:hypothetical protein